MSDKPDKSTVIVDAETEDDFETQVQGLKIDVLPRVQGPATGAVEQWQMHHLLGAMLAARQLTFPVRLYKSESPDFILQNGNTWIGIEARRVINCDYMRALTHPAAQRDDAVVDPSLYRWGTEGWGTERRSKSQIREEAGRTQLSGVPWESDSIEKDFAQSIKDAVVEKDRKLHAQYTRFDSDRLLIRYSQPSVGIHIDKARIYTAGTLVDYWNQLGFDTVYVHELRWMLVFTKDGSEIIHKFPSSGVPLGFGDNTWEELNSVEKVYLKLLEDEPTLSTIADLEGEQDSLNISGIDLPTLRRQWFANRDRDLERTGCVALLQSPDRLRLMTASEVAVCPATMMLFRGSVIEHVFRAVAEPISDAAVAGLHRVMVSRDPKFAAAVIGVLRYLSRFNDFTHWAPDSRRCSVILAAIDPSSRTQDTGMKGTRKPQTG